MPPCRFPIFQYRLPHHFGLRQPAGADPDTMASSVASPLENQFSAIAGIDQMTSSSTQGQTQIQLQFSLDRSIDGAAQDVQSAISAATRNLPKALPQPPTFRKQNPADIRSCSWRSARPR